jgi:TrmH family RNA methyltransferase
MPDIISSGSNPRIRKLVELQKKAKLRRETGLFVIEGSRLCADTPAQYIKEVYMTENRIRNASEKEKRLMQEHPVTLVTEEAMAKAADTTTPQGILCVAKMPVYSRESLLGKTAGEAQEADKADGRGSACGGAPLLLVLEDIQDPGNLGTIFRTAEAAGATGILMSRGTVDLFHPKVVRATMSAIFRMPFYISNDLCEEISVLRESGIPSYAAHLDGKRVYDELPLTQGCAFLIGNEGNGLSAELTAKADEKIIIPMAGGAESLNAAMAAGILVFEAARQRRVH